MLPEESKSGMFKESRYFTLAGKFAEPLESLIPESTIDLIRNKSSEVGLGDKKKPEKEEAQETKEEKKAQEQIDELFEKLAQPKIEKAVKEHAKEAVKDFKGYKKDETDNLDRLIENAVE